jgi:hypothetical protein
MAFIDFDAKLNPNSANALHSPVLPKAHLLFASIGENLIYSK